jgi:hypothetical protein
MGVIICPKCGAVVHATDTHCMDCGVNIVEAERELAQREKQERGGGPLVGTAQAVAGATAGMAEPGETSEKVRLKEFDKHLAEKLIHERSAVVVTAIIALVAGALVLDAGLRMLRNAGGMAALRALKYGELRERGLGAFADEGFLALLMLLLAVGGLLCAAGQIHRVVIAYRAVNQVRSGQRPDVVGISPLTWWGLLLASFIFPPFGLVLGIIFKFGQDAETRHLGGSMIKSAVIALAVIGVHLAWNALASFAAPNGSSTNSPVNDGV